MDLKRQQSETSAYYSPTYFLIGNDNKIFLYDLSGSITKQDMTETASNYVGGLKLWKGKLYVTDNLMNLKVK